mmetsp:Transcript_8530/g.20480  ORF Transcript_8530/g.20480 Transcript_8530/m.20480 type:complete len:296 (+) Transcript_8530:1210-2097(+)
MGSCTRNWNSWFHTGFLWSLTVEVSLLRLLMTACSPRTRRHHGLLESDVPQTGRFFPSRRRTATSPTNESGRHMPPAAPCCPSGSAEARLASSVSAWSTAEATACMMASRPTAASATAVTAGGITISRRSGSTIMPGSSSVSSLARTFCRIGTRMSGTRLYGDSCTWIFGGPTNARKMVPIQGHIGASRSLIQSFPWKSRSETITGTLIDLSPPKPTSICSSSFAPPVYRQSTTPLRSESFRELRRRMFENVGASWSSVNSTILRRRRDRGATSSMRLSKSGCRRSTIHRSRPRW